ncbi:flavin reductase [Variovorax sp. Sphag1AA]|uniref:flavin reductase n=1 Tax=Variovorax sp. Sphag1AA TaxID=2587027 RepID=UPI00160F21D3|nr:flavin reductase [Variovorax sp. Sphag1AA]MBB3181838.1 flavin reductase (DIM6/NTAB) family NADH-FMN oxidoreductase RutF [Variovorax sp. Sphag1AA]
MTTSLADSAQVTSEFKRAMRRLASTVTIISTADVNGNRYGMTATAVNSLTMDPPSLLICVNHSASIHPALMGRGRFCVNVLTTEHEDLVSAFSGRLKGDARFEVGEWRTEDGGMPYLEDAQSNLFCDIDSVVPFGTHSVVIGRVSAVRVDEGIRPLIFADGKLGATQSLTGHVRIASNLSTLTQFLPNDLQSFLKKHPLIDVHLEEKVSTAVLSAVQENACDIGLIVEGPKVSGLEVIPYREDRLVLTVPQDHSLADKASVKFAETLNYDYVGLHTGSQINLQIQRAAAELDKAWRCRMQVHTYDALAAMVQAGLGIGMLPQKMAQLYASAMNLKIVELDEPWAHRRHAIVIRSYESLQAAGKRLIDHLKRSSQ